MAFYCSDGFGCKAARGDSPANKWIASLGGTKYHSSLELNRGIHDRVPVRISLLTVELLPSQLFVFQSPALRSAPAPNFQKREQSQAKVNDENFSRRKKGG
ncbi:MAG TPA: hypothetical protein PKY50_00945 [Candidatus Competibacter sp.]|nr:hypothetical protein [Candidatus Competibacter sp.]